MESESLKFMNHDSAKLDRFDGNNFSRWQNKVKFLLLVLKIAYVLDPNLAPIHEDSVAEQGHEQDKVAIEDLNRQRKKRTEDKELARGHILNTRRSNRQESSGRNWSSSTKLKKKVQINT